jgi:hypothetical protein
MVHEIEGREVDVDSTIEMSEDIFDTLKEFYKGDASYSAEIDQIKSGIKEVV